MPNAGNSGGGGEGGGGGPSNGGGGGGGTWVSTGEGGQKWVPSTPAVGGFGAFGLDKPEDTGPQPHVPVIREARNVQKANIDRTSLYDPTQTTLALGRDYLQERNATNPQPLGSTGAGAVGYDFTPSNERLY